MTVCKDIRFYDTSSLLLFGATILQKKEKFVVSSITIDELQNVIKSPTKNTDIEYCNAKLVLDFFERNPEGYQVVEHEEQNETKITSTLTLNMNNGIKILSDVLYYDHYIRPDEVIFVTHDLVLGNIANMFLGDQMIEII